MRLNIVVIIIILSVWITSGCNKVRSYKIKIVNQTGLNINKLELKGTTDYFFAIVKGGETEVREIEWEGSRVHLAGEHCFGYYVHSFSDSLKTYEGESPCGSCIVVKDLSQKEINILTLKKIDPGLSDCKHLFKIEYKKY